MNYFSSLEESKKHKFNTIQTNDRYPSFTQTHYTAGDASQFEEHAQFSQLSTFNPTPSPALPFPLPSQLDWKSYFQLSSQDILNTFFYLFYKFKKGIYIQIQNNQVKTFLPFSNANFINEWHSYLSLQPEYENDWGKLFQKMTEKEGYTYHPNKFHKNRARWYANNHLIRYEYPIVENDTGVGVIHDMFIELCKHRKIPDIEFFINRRDCPLLTQNKTESYDALFGENLPLVSHCYDKYAPILGMCSTDKNADIPMPTWDDWARIAWKENKFFPRMPEQYGELDKIICQEIQWADKIPTAVFRGASTGQGTTIYDNARLKASWLSTKQWKDTDGFLFLDAGIVKWNARLRKKKNSPYLETIDSKNLSLSSYIPLSEQARYKYILHLPGHVCAFRLSMELASGSVLLKSDCSYYLWYEKELKPFVHYVPVKEDLSDLVDQIKWCKAHDKECQQIAKNALVFWKTFLQKEGMLDYLQWVLFTLKQRVGTYPFIPSTLEEEKKWMEEYDNRPKEIILAKKIETISSFPSVERCWENLIARHWIWKGMDWKGKRKEGLEIYQSKKTTITHLKEYQMIVKQSDNQKECIQQTFIGLKHINYLLQTFPYFAYTYGMKEDCVYTEYIEGITLQTFLTSEEYHWDTFFRLFLDILNITQECGFIHNDLYPWNIILYTCSSYPSSPIPVLIDYGKSIIQREPSIKDIITLLVSSLYVILTQHNVSKQELKQIFHLFSWLNPSVLTGNKVIKTVKELKQCLNDAKKYSFLSGLDYTKFKYSSPIEIFYFLKETNPLTFQPKFISMRWGDCRYFYDGLCGMNPEEAKKRVEKRLQTLEWSKEKRVNDTSMKWMKRIVQQLQLDPTLLEKINQTKPN